MSINSQWKRGVFFILWGCFLYSGYQVTNRWPIFEPVQLPMTALDHWIEFNVWTIIAYFFLILMTLLPVFIKQHKIFIEALMAATLAICLNYIVFIFFPTTFPRPEFVASGAFVDSWYLWLVSIDQPTNCFPSGHVAAPGVATWYLIKDNRRLGFLLPVYLLCVISVLTTKQHYAWDIAGGWTTMLLGVWFAAKSLKIKAWLHRWIS